jgi:hypothetical protein
MNESPLSGYKAIVTSNGLFFELANSLGQLIWSILSEELSSNLLRQCEKTPLSFKETGL